MDAEIPRGRGELAPNQSHAAATTRHSTPDQFPLRSSCKGTSIRRWRRFNGGPMECHTTGQDMSERIRLHRTQGRQIAENLVDIPYRPTRWFQVRHPVGAATRRWTHLPGCRTSMRALLRCAMSLCSTQNGAFHGHPLHSTSALRRWNQDMRDQSLVRPLYEGIDPRRSLPTWSH